MKFLLIVFTCWVSCVIAEQTSNNYNNVFHNQRYQDERIPSTSERIFHSEDKSPQISSRGSRTFNFDDYDTSYDGSYDGSLVETIPGKAGKDFPAYTTIPKTGFTCKGRRLGYFADPETNCQVFHICVQGGQKISFLCPNGSIFNQKVSVCDWWYDVDCLSSSELIDSNDIQRNTIYNEPATNDFQYQHFIVETEPYYDLSLASSGGNQHPKYENQASKNNNEQHSDNKNSPQEGRRKVLKSKSAKISTTSASVVINDDKNLHKVSNR